MICDSNQEEPVRPRSHRVTASGPLPRRSLLCAGHGAGVARCSPIIAPLPPFIVFLCLQSPWVRCDAQPVIPLLSTYSYSTPRSPSYISGRSQLPGPHLGKSTRSRPRGITPSGGGTIWHILHEGPNGTVWRTRHGQVVLVFKAVCALGKTRVLTYKLATAYRTYPRKVDLRSQHSSPIQPSLALQRPGVR